MGRPRGSYQVGERRRQQILEVAERLVLSEGHQAVTVKQIANEIGVTEPAVYHHFSSKEVLLVEVLRYRDEHAPEAEIHDPIEALAAALRHSQSTPTAMELYVDYSSKAADPAHPAHDYFRDRYDRFTAAIAQLIRDQGTDVAMPAVDAARILLALADGLQARWLVSRDFELADPLLELAAVWSRLVRAA